MKTFVVKFVYCINCSGLHTEQYEDQWRLVVATDQVDARTKALSLGKEEESLFIDRHGRTVSWKLLVVGEPMEFEQEHGVLLASSIREIDRKYEILLSIGE